MPTLILAHDLGTSGNKTSVYDEYGRLIAAAASPYPTRYFNGNWAEQNPEDWWLAVCRTTRHVLTGIEAKDIAAMSFSGHMTGCLPVDKDGRVLRPHILWADQRAVRQKAAIDERINAPTLYRLTGHRNSETTTLAKILWLKDNEPDIFARAAYFLNAKDYLVFRMTGEFATDPSDASATTLYDIRKGEWSDDLLGRFDVPKEKLPAVVASAEMVGRLTEEAALDTGLLQGLPVIMGGGDGSAANLGACGIAAGRVHASIGTSGWIMESSTELLNEVEDGTFNLCHVIPGFYSVTGTMQAAGSSYAWLTGLLRTKQDERATLEAAMAGIGPGSNGLLFLPYLMGERTPYWNPDAKGAFLGLKQETTADEMTRAVLEGVAFHLNIIRSRFDAAGTRIKSINAVGGGARSDLWCQILADVWQTDVRRLSRLEEAGALGAAVLAGVGVGIFPGFSVIDTLQSVERVFTPDSAVAAFYASRTSMLAEAYATTLPLMAALAHEDAAWLE